MRALASHQFAPGSIPGPGVICGLSLLLLLYSAPRGFSLENSWCSVGKQITFTNYNYIWTGLSFKDLCLVASWRKLPLVKLTLGRFSNNWMDAWMDEWMNIPHILSQDVLVLIERDRTSACKGAFGCRYQFIFDIILPPNPCMKCTMKLQIDNHTGNYVPYSFRQVCGFFNVPCWPCNTRELKHWRWRRQGLRLAKNGFKIYSRIS